ncbi:MAG: phosphatidylglycerophosphatase A [Rhodobacterales bacterium]|nr:phosphatidylglycerophosphatase A [Rhodobacterales bacterium]
MDHRLGGGAHVQAVVHGPLLVHRVAALSEVGRDVIGRERRRQRQALHQGVQGLAPGDLGVQVGQAGRVLAARTLVGEGRGDERAAGAAGGQVVGGQQGLQVQARHLDGAFHDGALGVGALGQAGQGVALGLGQLVEPGLQLGDAPFQALAGQLGPVALVQGRLQVGLHAAQVAAQGIVLAGQAAHAVLDLGQLVLQGLAVGDDGRPLLFRRLQARFHRLQAFLQLGVLLRQGHHGLVVLFQVGVDGGVALLEVGHVLQQGLVGQAGVGDLGVAGRHLAVQFLEQVRGEGHAPGGAQQQGQDPHLRGARHAHIAQPPVGADDKLPFGEQSAQPGADSAHVSRFVPDHSQSPPRRVCARSATAPPPGNARAREYHGARRTGVAPPYPLARPRSTGISLAKQPCLLLSWGSAGPPEPVFVTAEPSPAPPPPQPARPSPWAPATVLATWFWTGWLPGAPGTWGSLAALPVGWALSWWGGWPALLAGAAVVTALGTWAAGRYVADSGGGADADPGSVVVDEVAGQWIALLPAALEPLHVAAGFVLFRLFDIGKPWPVSWADRRVKGAWGIMLDDLLAGAYAAAVLFVLVRLLEGAQP